MKALVRATCLAVMVSIACAVPAVAGAAETLYAQGGGGNTTAPCSQAEPCNLAKAVKRANEAGAGSAVVLLPGPSFTPGQHLEVAGEVDIGGVPGQTRPTIEGPDEEETLVVRGGAHLHDVNVRGGNNFKTGLTGLQINHGSAERVYAEEPWGAGCVVRSGSLRDSVCVSFEGGGMSAGATGEPSTISLRNVTVVGREEGIVLLSPNEPSAVNTLEGVNTIAYSTGKPSYQPDVQAGSGAAGGRAVIVMRNSDYDSVLAEGPADSVTAPGTAGNTTAEPQFVDLDERDVHQLPTSPTVDAGLTEAANGDVDLDGDTRALSAHPTCDSLAGPTDIGAYEYVPPAPYCPPPTPPASDPGGGGDQKSAPPPTSPPPPAPPAKPKAPRTKFIHQTEAKIFFASSQPGSTFRCKLDKGKFKPCHSPYKLAGLAPGKHTLKVEAVAAGVTDPTPLNRHFRIAKAGGRS
jgi:hypothetical protein